jgi:hypothetical protein
MLTEFYMEARSPKLIRAQKSVYSPWLICKIMAIENSDGRYDITGELGEEKTVTGLQYLQF